MPISITTGKKAHLSLFVLFFIILLSAGCEKDPVKPDPVDPVIPDPYEQYGTPFNAMPANDDVVMYEVNFRAFSTGGDIQGVIDRLDEIKALGVNVIWLMPLHPIGAIKSVNSPYSVKDYKAVNPELGTLADLRSLTDQAHARGMAIMMDWVANHTSWDNAWISNRSWYTKDAAGTIVQPPGTNWQDVADLDFSSGPMRLAMIDALKYWTLEANVDGYRCDYADGVPFDFWKQAIDSLNKIPNRDILMLAEGIRPDHYTAGFDLNYAWDFFGKLKNIFNGQAASGLITTHNAEYNAIPAGKHKLRFTTNHDESAWDNSPIVIFKGEQGALAASTLAIFMGGVPLLYNGQEVGRATTTPFFTNSPIDWNANPEMLDAYKDLMDFYTHTDVARKGIIEDHSTNEVVAFTRTLGDEQIFVMVNTRNALAEAAVPQALVGLDWIDGLTGDSLQFGTTVELTNYQYLIARR